MQDGEAIIGIPDDAQENGGTVRKYNLNMDLPRSVLMPQEHQTLMDTQIIKENGNTIMTFSKLLREHGERTIVSNGKNIFLFVLGRGNDLSYFPDVEVNTFGLDFEITRPPSSFTITPAPSFGGIEVPEGIGRTQSPTGGYIRRDEPETTPVPTPNTAMSDTPVPTRNRVMSDNAPSDAAVPGTPTSHTITTDKTKDAATSDTSTANISNMVLSTTVALCLIYV